MSMGAGSSVASDTRHGSASGALYAFDRAEVPAGITLIGIDEAGRGPLAGPVVAAAVALDPAKPVDGVNDSKKLSARRRESLYESIVTSAIGWAVGSASVQEIERLNILQATFVAMKRAIDGLAVAWDMAFVDGNRIVPLISAERQKAVVGGDGLSASIAAASILAKVTRDRIMDECHRMYPAYGFDVHKGYGTLLHRENIRRFGLCAIHRASFCGGALQTSLEL